MNELDIKIVSIIQMLSSAFYYLSLAQQQFIYTLLFLSQTPFINLPSTLILI